MKIIIVNTTFSYCGGASLASFDLYKLLKQKGHEVVFFATNKKPYFEEEYEYSNYFPVYLGNSFDFVKHPTKFYYNFEAKNKFKKLLDNFNPDIVHLNSMYQITSSIINLCIKRNIPIVQTVHDANLICPAISIPRNCNIKCKNYNYINCLLNKCCQNNLEKSLRYMIYNYINNSPQIHQAIDTFIAPSQYIKNLLINNTEIPSDKVKIIPNFYENSFKSNISKQDYFLYVGDLCEEKGIINLIKAFENIPDNIKLKIAGTGRLIEFINKYIKEKNLQNIELLGYISRSDMHNLYNNCICLIQPSMVNESFGLTVIEAFAHAKPVIVSNKGALPEFINNTGVIYGDCINKLKIAIEYAYNNKDIMMKMGQSAQIEFLERYTKESYYNNLIDIYKKVINK